MNKKTAGLTIYARLCWMSWLALVLFIFIVILGFFSFYYYAENKQNQLWFKQILTEHKVYSTQLENDSVAKRELIGELTALFTPYKELDEALKQATHNKAERVAKKDYVDPTPCQTISKDLVDILNKKNILATTISGKSLGCIEQYKKCMTGKKEDCDTYCRNKKDCNKESCCDKHCAHQVVGILVEPQTGKVIKQNEFYPITLGKNWKRLYGLDYSFMKQELKP